ncbi:hypothetical protein V6N13_073747 [Hibiscus sabdariffa]
MFSLSNGTVLSTNWKEVGAKVEGSAPRGMEMKKWEYRVSSLFQIWTAFLVQGFLAPTVKYPFLRIF